MNKRQAKKKRKKENKLKVTKLYSALEKILTNTQKLAENFRQTKETEEYRKETVNVMSTETLLRAGMEAAKWK